jgi:hypothetical protein
MLDYLLHCALYSELYALCSMHNKGGHEITMKVTKKQNYSSRRSRVFREAQSAKFQPMAPFHPLGIPIVPAQLPSSPTCFMAGSFPCSASLPIPLGLKPGGFHE